MALSLGVHLIQMSGHVKFKLPCWESVKNKDIFVNCYNERIILGSQYN